MLRDNLVKDENGELVLGQWEAIVSADQWWTVQNLLDDPARVTNRSGSTVRKHLGRGFTGAESVASQCGLVLAPHSRGGRSCASVHRCSDGLAEDDDRHPYDGHAQAGKTG